MKYELVIFDMDGTILNTLDDLTDSLNYALEQSGYQARTVSEVKSFVGNGIRKLIERGVPKEADTESIQTVHERFAQYYKIHCADKTRPYEGICELLVNLRKKGIKTAVVSNKADFAVHELCIKYFDDMFDIDMGEREGVNKKPSPDMINEVIDRLSVQRKKTVYVGDSDVDIETARNAGIDLICVDWGFRDRDFLHEHGADIIVSAPDEICDIVYLQ